jgi:hypothetical protein
MALIIVSTACVGFLSSVALLAAGVRLMWLRYAMAVCIAYLFFLFLVWLWLLLKRKEVADVEPLGFLDVATGDGVEPELPGDGGLSDSGLAGGEFGGGGAGRSYGGAGQGSSPGSASPAGGSGASLLDLDISTDEVLVLVVLFAAICSGLVVSAYVVASAPLLFAEVLLDGALSYGLYRRLRRLDHRHWLESALARTYAPVLVVIGFFALAGVVMQWYAPSADSIGDVWHQFREGGP